MGCLAPFVFISLPIKHNRNTLHSSFQNNPTPIFALGAERKFARADPTEGHGVSGTICIYLIANKA